jgi:hypothetical protein
MYSFPVPVAPSDSEGDRRERPVGEVECDRKTRTGEDVGGRGRAQYAGILVGSCVTIRRTRSTKWQLLANQPVAPIVGIEVPQVRGKPSGRDLDQGLGWRAILPARRRANRMGAAHGAG